jgi:hypothetical protein
VLLDTPTITGPAGFTVPASGPPADAGTNHISATPQQVPTNPPAAAPPASTFGQSGGAFSYGFAPFNSSTTGAAMYPSSNPNVGGNALYTEPMYAPAYSFYGGPPAFPFFNDGTYPADFAGYSQGFTAFAATPVSGNYSLSVLVPASNAAPVTFNATSTLNAGIVLGVPTISGVTEDGKGGLSGTVTPGSGATETLVYVRDVTQALRYTIGPITGTAAATFTLPDNLGPCNSPGCGKSDTTPSIASATATTPGDTYQIYAVSFDYPAFEAAPPISTSATPTITGPNGQADLSVSAKFAAAY